jgi:hypothetical protein
MRSAAKRESLWVGSGLVPYDQAAATVTLEYQLGEPMAATERGQCRGRNTTVEDMSE